MELTEEELIPTETPQDVTFERHQLLQLIESGKSREIVGKTLTVDKVKRMKDSKVLELYDMMVDKETAIVSKHFSRSILSGVAKLIMKVAPIGDCGAYEEEFKNDQMMIAELDKHLGNCCFRFSPLMAVISGIFTTLRHMKTTNKTVIYNASQLTGGGEEGERNEQPTEIKSV